MWYIFRGATRAVADVGAGLGGFEKIRFFGSSGSKSDVTRNMLAGGVATIAVAARVSADACMGIADRFSLVGP